VDCSHQVFRIRLLGHDDIAEGVTRCPAQVPALVESRTIACTPKVAKRREMGSGGDFYGGVSRGERPISFSLSGMGESERFYAAPRPEGERTSTTVLASPTYFAARAPHCVFPRAGSAHCGPPLSNEAIL
jgi:hypothetical protein